MKSILTTIIFFALILVRGSSADAQLLNNGDTYGSLSNNGILGNLSGPGRYVAVEHRPQLNPGNTGTIEAWIFLNSNSGGYIVQKGSSFSFGVNFLGNLFLNINGINFDAGGQVPANRWVHVAASWTYSNPNISVSFFIDGSQTGFSSTQSVMISNSDSLTIGGSRLFPTSFLNGYIDEVRLWNTVSNAPTIAERRFIGLGDAPSANIDSAITYNQKYNGLIASWTFNIGGNIVYEDINNYNGFGRGGAEPIFTNIQGQPIPYNLSMWFPGTRFDYIKVPHNTAFNLTNTGSIDLWAFRFFSTTGYTLISKGSTLNTTTFRLYIESSGSLRMQIGNNSVPGGVVPNTGWSHIAVTWTHSGGTYTVKFYINGQYIGQNTITGTMPVNTDELRIGNLQWDVNNNYLGLLDEVRIWQRELTADEVKANMFNSARSQTTMGPLVAAWDFEGNLNNVTPATGFNGTFKTGNTTNRPNCIFLGYNNSNVTGPITDLFEANSTTINRKENPNNPFPGGYSLKVPNKTVPLGSTVYDTIVIQGNVTLNNIEVFLSLQHPNVGGIFVRLKAPNGQERILVNGNGGNGNNILTFFKDGSPLQNTFYAPWSYLVSPFNTFGNFGGSQSQGSWVLSIQHAGTAPEAYLKGWGLRINNSVTGINIISNSIPEKFSLAQNFPNPFNPATEIRFDIPRDEHVKILVYDILGKEIDVLINEYKKAGEYKATFDASNLPSGVYFYTINAGAYSDTKKMILIK